MQEEAYSAMIDAAESGRVSLDIIDKANARIAKLKADFPAQTAHIETIRADESLDLMRSAANKSLVMLKNSDMIPLEHHNKKVGLISRLRSFVTKDIFLTEESMRYYCELLYLFKQELEKNDNVYDQEIEKLRIDIVLFYMNELKPWISKRDLDKLMKIEHFQESNNSTLKLINFIPDDFYKT